jgi:hypothetical protein
MVEKGANRHHSLNAALGDANCSDARRPRTQMIGKNLEIFEGDFFREGGVGHNLRQEAPAAFSQAVIDVSQG